MHILFNACNKNQLAKTFWESKLYRKTQQHAEANLTHTKLSNTQSVNTKTFFNFCVSCNCAFRIFHGYPVDRLLLKDKYACLSNNFWLLNIKVASWAALNLQLLYPAAPL
jgi:hypothetical protein